MRAIFKKIEPRNEEDNGDGNNDYTLERISIRHSKREKKAFKHCIRKEKTIAWTHLERRESSERSD